MSEKQSHSILNHDVLKADPKIHVDRRPSIKIATTPEIVVAIPCGDKHEASTFLCAEDHGGCGKAWLKPAMRQPNLIPVQLMLAHMNLVAPLNCSMSYMVEAGRLSAEARQIMTTKAIEIGAKFILYWDDDTIPPPMALYTLYNWMCQNPKAGAVSGIYTTREDPNEPLVYTAHGEGAAWDLPIGPGAKPQPIFGAGAGFLLARIDAITDTIERLKEENGGVEVPIWADERTLEISIESQEKTKTRPSMWGHDVRFCKVLNETGWQVYAHGQVLCGHLDIPTGKMFRMPKDAPGWKHRPNSPDYWDAIYTKEGADTWRRYPEMFQKVADEVPRNSMVVELGCGVGVLGSKLTAEKKVEWHGYDISEKAVEIAKQRFLNASQLDVTELAVTDLMPWTNSADVIVATEIMEHLEEDAFHHVINMVEQSGVKKFVFTVPDNCMGPDEIPEHTALFSQGLVLERTKRYTAWTLRMEQADEKHIICVMER